MKLPYAYPSLTAQGTLYGLAQEVLKMFQRIAKAFNEPDHGATGARPTSDLTTGQFFFDDTLNSPVWWDNDALAWVVGVTTATVSGAGNPTAQVGPAAINGTATTFMRSDAAPKLADTVVTPGAYTYASLTVDQQGRLTAASNGAAPASPANPTAEVGPVAINGAATTYMRSDAAPKLADTAVTPGSYTYGGFTVDQQGRLTAASTGAAPVTSVTGTADRITISGGASTPVVDIAVTYAGQATITTLGTIGTGVWQGTKVTLTYGGTNADASAWAAGTIPFIASSAFDDANFIWTASSRPASTTTTGVAIGSNYDTFNGVNFWNTVNSSGGNGGFYYYQKLGASSEQLLGAFYGDSNFSQFDFYSGTVTTYFGADSALSEVYIGSGSTHPVTFYSNGVARANFEASTYDFHLYGGANGQRCGIKALTELTTIAAAAFTDTTIQIPAEALVVAVSVRSNVAIPTAVTYDVGVAGATTRYATAVSDVVGTTAKGTLAGILYYAAATSIRITPNAVPASGSGRIRVTIHYIEITAPSS